MNAVKMERYFHCRYVTCVPLPTPLRFCTLRVFRFALRCASAPFGCSASLQGLCCSTERDLHLFLSLRVPVRGRSNLRNSLFITFDVMNAVIRKGRCHCRFVTCFPLPTLLRFCTLRVFRFALRCASGTMSLHGT